jgi:hypothetical protein
VTGGTKIKAWISVHSRTNAVVLLTLLGAAGEALGYDRMLRTSTVKRRVHSLLRQDCMLYDLMPS